MKLKQQSVGWKLLVPATTLNAGTIEAPNFGLNKQLGLAGRAGLSLMGAGITGHTRRELP